MNPAIAAQIVAALDRELDRRCRVREEAEEAQWLAEDPTGLTMVARMAQRLVDRLDRPLPGPAPIEPASVEAIEGLAAILDHLAVMVERDVRREEDEANGIVHRPRPSHVRSGNRLIAPKPVINPAAPVPPSRRVEATVSKCSFQGW